jgi:hypothetical protein
MTRAVLGAAGLALMAYAGWLLLGRAADLPSVLTWLVAGVVLHDAVLVPLVLGLCLLGRLLLPVSWRRPALLALVVTGSLSLAAVPVLGRFGARADNPTLLDRPYLLSWAVLLALTVAAVVLAGAVGRYRRR